MFQNFISKICRGLLWNRGSCCCEECGQDLCVHKNFVKGSLMLIHNPYRTPGLHTFGFISFIYVYINQNVFFTIIWLRFVMNRMFRNS